MKDKKQENKTMQSTENESKQEEGVDSFE